MEEEEEEEERKINVHDNIKHDVNIKEEAQNKNFTQAGLSGIAEESKRHWLLTNHRFCKKKKKSIQGTTELFSVTSILPTDKHVQCVFDGKVHLESERSFVLAQ